MNTVIEINNNLESNSVVVKIPINTLSQSAYCYVATVNSGTHALEIEGNFYTGMHGEG